MEDKSNFKKIIVDGNEYAIVINGNDLPEGVKFYTDDDKFLQVATWKHNKGHEMKPHSHKVWERISNRVHEFIYVIRGSIEVTLYNEDEKVIAKETLNRGTAILIFNAGHKYRMLEDNTEAIEVKNGPYPGMEKDKKEIHDD